MLERERALCMEQLHNGGSAGDDDEEEEAEGLFKAAINEVDAARNRALLPGWRSPIRAACAHGKE